MCKMSINNRLWPALVSVVHNIFQCLKDGNMLLDTVKVCVSLCQELYHGVFFPSFFLPLPVLKTTQIWAISKPIMDIFLQILDENWLDDT